MYLQPAAASSSQVPAEPDLGHKLKATPQQGECGPDPLQLAMNLADFQGCASELEGLVPIPPEERKLAFGLESVCLVGQQVGRRQLAKIPQVCKFSGGHREATRQLQTNVQVVFQGQHKL